MASSGIALAGVPHVLSTSVATGSGQLWLDGVALGAPTAVGPATWLLVGTTFQNASYTLCAVSTGDIAEIVYYPVALSASDRAAVEACLGAKYAIAIGPPASDAGATDAGDAEADAASD